MYAGTLRERVCVYRDRERGCVCREIVSVER